VISPAKDLWRSLGACQAGGTAIDWVMRAEGVSFRHAVKPLRAGVYSLAGADANAYVLRVTLIEKWKEHTNATRDQTIELQPCHRVRSPTSGSSRERARVNALPNCRLTNEPSSELGDGARALGLLTKPKPLGFGGKRARTSLCGA